MRILIADDAPDVAQVVAFGAQITWPGCEVQIANNGADALKLFEAARPDLVVLDIEMPPPDGLEVCKRIREIALTPILMLTVRDSTLDKVLALDIGADDYLTKPFNHSELLARMRALVRRSTGPFSRKSGARSTPRRSITSRSSSAASARNWATTPSAHDSSRQNGASATASPPRLKKQ